MDKITDLVSGVPAKVPPFHTVNHEINLIDPNKQIHYWLHKCPDTGKEELAERSVNTPVQAGGFPQQYAKLY